MASLNLPIKDTGKGKVKDNKLSDKLFKYTADKINCIALEGRCNCYGNLKCTPKFCGLLEAPLEIQSPDSHLEQQSIVGGTKFCAKSSCDEAKCVEKTSWKPCGDRNEKKLGYSESEIRCFIEVIEEKLKDSLGRQVEPLVCKSNVTATEIPGARNCRETFLGNNVQRSYFTGDVCAASLTSWVSLDDEEAHVVQNVDEEKIELSKNLGQRPVQDICKSYEPIILQDEKKCKEYSNSDESIENSPIVSTARINFKIGDIGRSEEIGKWGKLDIADRLLADYKHAIDRKRSQQDKDGVVRESKDKLDEPDRFLYLNKKDLAALGRQLFRWSDRLSKKWRILNSQPHVVIHLVSLGYPIEIRRRASHSFHFLQNIQVFRLGWLANKNAQVLYIIPSNQNLDMIKLFKNLIKNVRPDVNEDRLWIVQSARKECSENKSLNGSRAFFQSLNTYRRVKMLTAGRQAFILPGIIENIDVLIASELRVPIMGPPLKFQNHFLNKSNVANFLKKINVDQPPFVPDVHNFAELCEGLARLMIEFPNYVTWLIKINHGINGLQTALISFEKNLSREIIAKYPRKEAEKKLIVFLIEILDGEMIFNKQAYKSSKEFFSDLEKYGGLIQGCPYVGYRVLSFGIFIEHERSTPEVCASADVFHIPEDLTSDLCYGIPQATTARLPLENLALNVGIALQEFQYIGYFGIDVVVLKDQDSMVDKFFVVDIDPYYTDVIAFTDWIKFCLEVDSHCQNCRLKTYDSNLFRCLYEKRNAEMDLGNQNLHSCKIVKAKNRMERYAVCSGKLYSNGLSKYLGTTLVSLCEERNVRYNLKIKQGSMICPIDSELRALGLISLYPKRSRAIDEFAKGLRVLHELSLEKHNDKIETNMLKLARALERRELGRARK